MVSRLSTTCQAEVESSFDVTDLRGPVWARVARVSMLFLSDVAALLVVGMFAYLVWAAPVRQLIYAGSDPQPASLYLALLPLLPLFGVGYAGAGLYPGFGLGAV